MILHRAIVNNVFLNKCNIKDTDKCYYCSETIETIEHLFWECMQIKNLWQDFANKLQPYIDIQRFLSKDLIIFGVEMNENELLINHLLILVKRYIYVQKCREKTICVNGLLTFVKQQFILDTNSGSNECKTKKWLPLKNFIQEF